MSRLAPWRWGALFLAALLAAPAPSAVAATAAPQRTPEARTAPSATAKKATTTRKRTRRPARRPPGGVVWARHAIVVDPTSEQVLFEKDAGASVPVASLSKLMTALVFVAQQPDLDRVVEVTTAELTGGGHTQLLRGERVRLGDLLHMSLMVSDNVATRVLVRESGLTAEDFLARMNRKAVDLGLARTRFVEFTGLDQRNVSTAADIARLLRAASADPLIHEISVKRGYDFRGTTRRGYARAHHIGNTNRLLYGRYEVRGGKTGFISSAGYCFATWIRTEGRDMIAVVLGAPTNATRFADVVRMVQHTSTPSVAPRGL